MRRSQATEVTLPLDLHVLGLPLAFILSQDQTLHSIFLLSNIYTNSVACSRILIWRFLCDYTVTSLYAQKFVLFTYYPSMSIFYLEAPSSSLLFPSRFDFLPPLFPLLHNPLPSNWDRKGNTLSTIPTSFLFPFFYFFLRPLLLIPFFISFPITYAQSPSKIFF